VRALPVLAAAVLWAGSLAPGAARAQGRRQASAPIGLTLAADLGVGGAAGTGTRYTPSTVAEGELLVGYLLGKGLAPELGIVLGMSPGSYLALRPGLHYALPGMPFYVRAALDLATVRGYLQARWLLLGGGGELRLTSQTGGFAELCTGIPISTAAGVPFLVRAGMFFSF
jgi:hypothetical protein